VLEKKPVETKHLSEVYEPAPHIDRDDTIVSAFLDRGEREEVQKRQDGEVRAVPKYPKTRSWEELWDDRHTIYWEKKVQHIETYEPTSVEKLFAMVGYLAFFVPMLVKSNRSSGFVRFHMKQSVNMLLFNLLFAVFYGLVIYVVGLILPSSFYFFGLYVPEVLIHLPGDGDLTSSTAVFITLSVFWLLPIYLFWCGIANSSNGLWKPLPLIGKEFIAD